MVAAGIRTLGQQAFFSPAGRRRPGGNPCLSRHPYPITVAGQLRNRTGFPLAAFSAANPDVVLGAIDKHKIFDRPQKINRKLIAHPRWRAG
jgi:hypothetical protein